MHKYISDLIKAARDEENFEKSKKDYFSPWWKFWDRKVKVETSSDNCLRRHFDETGILTKVDHQCSALSSNGFRSRYYWETLDLKTNVVTSQPFPGCVKRIYPDGKCEETYDRGGGKREVFIGHINSIGDNQAFACITFQNDQQVGYRCLKKAADSSLWKEILKKHSAQLEEKAIVLDNASQTIRQKAKRPETEAEQRALNNAVEKGRAKAHRRFSSNKLSNMRLARYHRRHGSSMK